MFNPMYECKGPRQMTIYEFRYRVVIVTRVDVETRTKHLISRSIVMSVVLKLLLLLLLFS